jgi:NAD+ kinase
MKKIGIYINESFRQFLDISKLINEINKADNPEIYCSQKQYPLFPQDIKISQKGEKLDCILVFGGDGTILNAVDYALQSCAPILGVNSGKLGFLTDFSLAELDRFLPKLFQGEYQTLDRLMLVTIVSRLNKLIYKGFALNDAVIYKGLVSRLIDIKLYASGKFVLETRCDGMIASTPTGSTAYSLSAGGPILSPDMDALIAAAICPHVLSVRPMVFPICEKLQFKMSKIYNETMLQIDGRNVLLLADGDLVTVKAAENKVSFLTLTGKSFYQTLRKKLHMGKL